MLGVLFCCREAIRVMKSQATTGHIFNMVSTWLTPAGLCIVRVAHLPGHCFMP